MSRLTGWRHSLGSMFRRAKADQETRDEIAFHVERQTRKHIDKGLSPEVARRKAELEFGGSARWREATADTRRGSVIESFRLDARYGVRSLRRHAGFTVVAVLTLAVGMGATMAAFSTIDHVLLRALPYPQADRLVELRETNDRSPEGVSFSDPNLNDVRLQTSSFASITGVSTFPWMMSVGADVVSIGVGYVSGNFFDTFGVHAYRGRLIGPDDARTSSAPVAVLSYDAWRRWDASDPAILGRPVRLSGSSYTVVGIAQRGFAFPDGAGVWIACRYCDKAPESMRASIGTTAVARLAPGATLAQANADVAHAAGVIHRDHPNPAENQMVSARAVSLKDTIVTDSQHVVLLLSGAVAFVLLIGCANLASANLARNLMRQRELALRTALGASRARVVQQLLMESILLAAGACLLGLGAAALAVRAIAAHAATLLPRMIELNFDWHAALFGVVASVAVAVAIGLVPALSISGRDPRQAMGAPGHIGAASARGRRLLIGAEMMLCVVLLVGAGLALRSLQLVLREPVGIDPQGIMTLQPQLQRQRYRTGGQAVLFYDRFIERLRGTPGIVDAAAASAPPLGFQWTGFISVEGQAGVNPSADVAPAAGYNLVTEGFFSTVKVPLLRGRLFTSADDSLHPDVTVINQAMADLYWPHQDPLGKRFKALSMDSHAKEWLTVVGVVGNIHYYTLEMDVPPMHYVSIRQRPERALGSTVVLRSTLAPGATVAAVHSALQAVDPTASAHVTSIDDRIAETTASRRLMVQLLTGFAGIALLLASIGVYGVLSYVVAQRTREIGIRMALGASFWRVVGMVAADVMGSVAIGLIGGLIGARLLSKLMAGLVYKLSPMDPLVLSVTCLALVALAALAAFIPARRAASIDPVLALRQE
jgi:putative ABC transport system permease protein